jgi:hypothetical protein
MDTSLLQIIAEAAASVRSQGLGPREQREAVRAALLAHDPSLNPGVARVLVERLFPAGERGG